MSNGMKQAEVCTAIDLSEGCGHCLNCEVLKLRSEFGAFGSDFESYARGVDRQLDKMRSLIHKKAPAPRGSTVEAFSELVGDLLLNAERSPFFKAKPLEWWVCSLADEAEEAFSAVEGQWHTVKAPSQWTTDELNHIAEEVGDVLWNAICVAFKLSEAGGPKLGAILVNASAKLRECKPWIFDPDAHGALPASEEEHERYQQRKRELAAKKGAVKR